MPGAIIDAAGVLPGASPDPSSVSPNARTGGLTLVERAVLTAHACGAAPLILISADPLPVGRSGGRRLPAGVQRITPDEIAGAPPASSDATRWLVLPVHTVVDTGCLKALAAEGQAGGTARMAACAEGSRPASKEALWNTDGEGAARLLAGETPRAYREVPVPQGAVCCAVIKSGDLAEAQRRLLASQTSDTDGWVDRIFNRHISRAFSRVVLNTPITPDQVTVLHILLGLAGATCFLNPSYAWGLLGALLFQFSVALDCSDGEVARIKVQFSRGGGLLDVIGDNVVHAAVFVAIGFAAKRALGAGTAIGLGVSAAVGIVIAFLVVWLLTEWQKRRIAAGKPAGVALAPVAANHALMGTGAAVIPPERARMDALINQLTSRDFSVLVVAAAVLGHLEWMLWLAAVGAHVFWLGFLLLQLHLFRTANAASA